MSVSSGLRMLSLALLSLAACESATNLDVQYADAGTSVEAGAGDAEAGAPGLPNTFPGCPCDETAGLGCCIPKVGNPFCTADTDFCTAQKGTHLKCGRPDPLTESACCWHFPAPRQASGAVTALGAVCDAGPAACTTDSDCAGTGMTCKTTMCGGVAIGECATDPPPCAK